MSPQQQRVLDAMAKGYRAYVFFDDYRARLVNKYGSIHTSPRTVQALLDAGRIVVDAVGRDQHTTRIVSISYKLPEGSK